MPLKDREARKKYQRKYASKHYKNNKDTYKSRAKIRMVEQRRILRDLLNSKKQIPCSDCKIPYPPYVMDFDHRDGGKTKLDNVSTLANKGCSIETIIEEIAKCDVVCANCHRIREYNRRLKRDLLT